MYLTWQYYKSLKYNLQMHAQLNCHTLLYSSGVLAAYVYSTVPRHSVLTCISHVTLFLRSVGCLYSTVPRHSVLTCISHGTLFLRSVGCIYSTVPGHQVLTCFSHVTVFLRSVGCLYSTVPGHQVFAISLLVG